MANLWELWKYHTARTGEERWDADRWCNADALKHHERTLRWATRLGMAGLADRAQAEITEGQFMAERAERCPNNPANGGRGYDTGDGTWVDRRGPEWVSVEDHFAGTDVLDRVDGIRDSAGEVPGWFARRRASHELGKTFGALDIYEAEIRGSGAEADTPACRAELIERIDRLVATAPPRALAEYIGLFEDVDPRTATNADYVEAWEDIKAERATVEVEERLDEIDPLTRDDVTAVTQGSDAGQGLAVDELILLNDNVSGPVLDVVNRGLAQLGMVIEPEQEQELTAGELAVGAAEPEQYLGYTDGELVRDVRSGVTGRVRVRDDEETGWYAEVQWDGLFVTDELELAIDNGLEREQGDNEAAPGVGSDADTDLVNAAREWLRDCSWSDLHPDDVAELSDDEVLRGIEQHYDGGLAVFEEAERPAPLNALEAELDAEPADDDETPGAPDVAEPELDTSEQQLSGPADDVELAEPEPGTNDETPAPEAAEQSALAAELEQPALTADEPVLTADESELVTEPELTVDEPDLDDEPVTQSSTSWWQSTTAAAKDWVGNKAAVVRGRIADKTQFAKEWIAELCSGRHRQCHGAWEEPSPFGGVSECTIQVAKNEFGVSLEAVQEAYGPKFVNDVLYRNDIEHHSFNKTADFIERTQLQGRDVELER